MGFADGWLTALGADDGVIRWERKLTLSGGNQFLDVDSTPVLDDDGHVFATSYKDGVYALNAETGDIVWSTARTGLTSLLLRGHVLFATGDGSMTAFDTQEGRTLWTLDLSDPTSKGAKGNNAGQAPMLTRSSIVVPTSTALAFVEPSTGKVLGAWNPGRGVSATPMRFQSARHGARLYVLSNLGTVYALHLANGGR
jgi:outer membrane protein assembly factor BamB